MSLRSRKPLKLLLRVGLLAAVALLGAGRAQAGLLGIVLNDAPDTVGSSPNMSYNALSQAFSLTDSDLEITFDGVTLEPITNGLLSINMQIDNSGNFISGMLHLEGAIFSRFIPSTITLLDGTLTAGGTRTAPFLAIDATFTPTGGALQADYAGVGGIIINTLTSGLDFSSDFLINSGLRKIDVGVVNTVVPEPASMTAALIGGGLLSLIALRKRLPKRV